MNITPATPHASPVQPADFPRRILLAVSGLTPQIVTETLYALAADEHAPFVPTEVHLITSAEGARRATLSLLSDDLGWFHKLCADYHLPGVKFDASHIHVMRDAHGQPMNDIRSPADNREQMRKRMHHTIPEQGAWLEAVVRGFNAYHAVPTNSRAIGAFRYHVVEIWLKSLRRRSQKYNLTWERMLKLAAAWLPTPRILHPWPQQRFAVKHPR